MSTPPKTVPAGEFKAHCLALLDKVARTRQPLIVTKRGKPVAKIVPTETHTSEKLLGSVKFHGNIVAPILDNWKIEQQSREST
jgi:prevent-host-death family protein